MMRSKLHLKPVSALKELPTVFLLSARAVCFCDTNKRNRAN